MRLLIVGTLRGQHTTATKIAMDKGASVTHADRIDTAMAVLRSGKGADLLMVDVAIDIRDLVLRLEAERIHVPIVACGTQNDAHAAVAARRIWTKNGSVLWVVCGSTRRAIWLRR
jgi:two-component system response regulator FlrC